MPTPTLGIKNGRKSLWFVEMDGGVGVVKLLLEGGMSLLVD